MNELLLYGTVGSSWWEEEYFTAKTVRESLAGMSGPVTVRINSGGGIATEGQAIYNALRGYAGQVNVVVEGVAASAASLIAMAGDTITMSLGAIMMIHDPASWYVEGRGTEDDHLHAANSLGVIANAYAGIYAKQAGIAVDEARTIMKAETYYDGPAALDAGFATAVDDDADAVEPAAFDYRLYQHAPQRLLTAAGMIQRNRPRAQVLAMMAGISPKPAKGAKAMAKNKPAPKGRISVTTASGDEEPRAEEEEDVVATTDDDPTAVEEEGDEAAPDDDPTAEEEEEATASAPAEALAIYRMCARSNLPQDRAEDFIARGLTCVQAVAELNGKDSKVTTRNHAPQARILRDERETRRVGLEAAIVARLNGQRDAKGPAQAFMGMTLVQMAAASVGHRGVMLDWGDKERVLKMAMHTTSDFPAIFENALNKQLLDRYALATPTYRRIAKKKNFRDFRPMPLVRTGDFPMLKPIGEAGEIKWGTFSDSGEQALISPYAVGVSVSRQSIINDDLGAIDDVLGSYGESVALWEEMMFYQFAMTAVMADGKAIFHADHGNLAGAAAAINDASVGLGRAAMRKQKSIDKNPILGNVPNILLVGPDKQTEAERHVAETTPTKSEDVNVTGRGLSVEVSDVLTGNAWYLISERNAPWVYGYLEGQEAPRLRTEEPFGRQGFSMTLEHDFGLGAADYRGAFKNAGN